jgi:hypothetical protein
VRVNLAIIFPLATSESSFFECESRRISLDMLCDGNADCEDGADEQLPLCDSKQASYEPTSCHWVTLSFHIKVE